MSFFEVNQVVKQFGALTAVNKVSFSLQAGEILSLVGESGSGKTTLLRMMACLIEPEAGSIELAGKNLTFFAQYLVKGHPDIRLVAQDFQLFPNISLRENIAYALRNAEYTYQSKRTDELLTLCGLTSIQHRLPKEVSGGEKQRLSIARALLRKPNLMVFDEATSALDSLTEDEINDTIKQVSSGNEHITIMIAHRLSTIMHTDRIYVLERGNIVEQGKHEDLIDHKGLYYAMWRQQIGERKFAEA